jgi:hypothetical protein
LGAPSAPGAGEEARDESSAESTGFFAGGGFFGGAPSVGDGEAEVGAVPPAFGGGAFLGGGTLDPLLSSADESAAAAGAGFLGGGFLGGASVWKMAKSWFEEG